MKTIIFDLMGVIFKQGNILKNILIPVLRPNKSYGEVKAKYDKYKIGVISKEEFWEGISSNIDADEKKYLEAFELADNFDIVHELKKKYKVAILSDVPKEWGFYLVKKFKLNKIFNPIIMSWDVMLSKRDGDKIYRLLLEKLNSKECFFIDDIKANLRTASKLGIKTIWLENDDFRHVDKDFKPDFTIRNFNDLRGIFL